MDDVSQLRGKRSTYSDNKAAVSSIDEYVFVLFGLCSSHHPHRSAHNESQRKKKKPLHFPISASERWPIVSHRIDWHSSAAGLAYEFPTFTQRPIPPPPSSSYFFNDRSLKALPVNKSPRPSAPTGHDTDIFFLSKSTTFGVVSCIIKQND